MLGDKNRLKQIFKNVIDNAIKYSHKDGKVFVNLTQKEGQAVINTKDQGVGIGKEYLPFVNQPFYQINTHSSGAGIGLAIVKEIVELHDGTVSIVSKEEMGTVILIKLPL